MSEVKFLPFRSRDLDSLDVQDRHEGILKAVRIRPFTLLDAEDTIWSFTMWGKGQPRACCGVGPEGGLWAFLAKDMKYWMLPLYRYGRVMIDAHVAIVGPVWASVDPQYGAAVHLAKLAGFRPLEPSLWTYP